MKPITSHAFLPHAPRHWISLRHLGHSPVKRRVETRDLLERRPAPRERPNHQQFMRQVLRRQPNQRIQRRQQFSRDRMRLAVLRPSVNHPMPHGVQPPLGQPFLQPGEQGFQRRLMIAQIEMLVHQRLPLGVAHVEPASLQPDPLDASAKHQHFRRFHLIHGELQARRAAVDRQHAAGVILGHGCPRRAWSSALYRPHGDVETRARVEWPTTRLRFRTHCRQPTTSGNPYQTDRPR